MQGQVPGDMHIGEDKWVKAGHQACRLLVSTHIPHNKAGIQQIANIGLRVVVAAVEIGVEAVALHLQAGEDCRPEGGMQHRRVIEVLAAQIQRISPCRPDLPAVAAKLVQQIQVGVVFCGIGAIKLLLERDTVFRLEGLDARALMRLEAVQ